VREPPPAPERVDLNSASFEQASHVLSVTPGHPRARPPSARGGYSGPDDLDDVPGFPEGSLDDLKRRVTV
jgi:DNA uptake protein ComE-like DNA-binding protein